LKILITGAAGFLGSHVVDYFLDHTDWEIVVIDCLTYASFGWDRLRDNETFYSKRVSCYSANFSLPFPDGLKREIGEVGYILHIGAESHVDHSITRPLTFIETNVIGTAQMLEFAREQKKLKQFIQFSSDEVFGPARIGQRFRSWDAHNPTNPYAASKSSAEQMALAYSNTYDIPVLIAHCSNIFGERQHPEKFIPMATRLILNGETVSINADKNLETIGSRYYIYAQDVASAILFLIDRGPYKREKVNIPALREVDNLEMAGLIADALMLPLQYELVDPDIGRHSHDIRYDLDGTAMIKAGWHPSENFDEQLEKVVRWFMYNPEWLGA